MSVIVRPSFQDWIQPSNQCPGLGCFHLGKDHLELIFQSLYVSLRWFDEQYPSNSHFANLEVVS